MAGAYFITVRAKGGACIFGSVADGMAQISGAGEIVSQTWNELPRHYPNVVLDAFVVMPNHVHGIVIITKVPDGKAMVGAGLAPPGSGGGEGLAVEICVPIGQGERPAPTLGAVVGTLKSKSAIQINRHLGRNGTVWQRNYYEHIIRNQKSMDKIRHYISDNPARWAVDRDNPAAAEHEAKNAWLL